MVLRVMSFQVKAPMEADQSGRTEEFRLEDFLPYRLSVAADLVSRLVVSPSPLPIGTRHAGVATAGSYRSIRRCFRPRLRVSGRRWTRSKLVARRLVW